MCLCVCFLSCRCLIYALSRFIIQRFMFYFSFIYMNCVTIDNESYATNTIHDFLELSGFHRFLGDSGHG